MLSKGGSWRINMMRSVQGETTARQPCRFYGTEYVYVKIWIIYVLQLHWPVAQNPGLVLVLVCTP